MRLSFEPQIKIGVREPNVLYYDYPLGEPLVLGCSAFLRSPKAKDKTRKWIDFGVLLASLFRGVNGARLQKMEILKE